MKKTYPLLSIFLIVFLFLNVIIFLHINTSSIYAASHDNSNFNSFVSNEQELEDLLISKMLSLDTQFSIKGNPETISGNTISETLNNIKNNPEIVQIYGSCKLSYSDDGEMTVNVKYNTDKSTENKVNSYISKWVKKNIRQNMTEEQKVRTIHDFMVSTFKYNFGDSNSKSGGHLIYMPSSLIYGDGGVCQAYSSLFYKMAKEADLQTQFVIGHSENQNYSGPHAWNMIKIDGIWYHIDVTWDDPIPDIPNRVKYDYYLKSDSKMSKTHTWDKSKYPKAPKNYK